MCFPKPQTPELTTPAYVAPPRSVSTKTSVKGVKPAEEEDTTARRKRASASLGL